MEDFEEKPPSNSIVKSTLDMQKSREAKVQQSFREDYKSVLERTSTKCFREELKGSEVLKGTA